MSLLHNANFPEEISKAEATYSRFTLHKRYIDRENIHRLNEIFNINRTWLQYYPKSINDLNIALAIEFRNLDIWLNGWFREEDLSSTLNKSKLHELKRILNECFIAVLNIFLFVGVNSIDLTSEIARNLVEYPKYIRFEDMICEGLEEIITRSVIPYGRIWVDIRTLTYDYLESHFKLFMKKNINPILLSELKKINNIETNIIFLEQIRYFIKSIYSSFEDFTKIIIRCDLYEKISQDLHKKGLVYENLKLIQNEEIREYISNYENYINRKESQRTDLNYSEPLEEFNYNVFDNKIIFRLKVTKSPYSEYRNKEYFISPLGLPDSHRYLRDFIITLGQDSILHFSNDIQLRGMNDGEIIIAIMYLSQGKLFLMDFSSDSIINMKLMPNEEISLIDGQIIVLGEKHLIAVSISKGVHINGANISSIQLSSYGQCESTANINNSIVDYDSPLKIGRSPRCGFIIEASDIMEEHALIYYNRENNSYMLKDTGMGSETSYKLKTQNQMKESEPSNPKELKDMQIFFIGGYGFLFSAKNPNAH